MKSRFFKVLATALVIDMAFSPTFLLADENSLTSQNSNLIPRSNSVSAQSAVNNRNSALDLANSDQATALPVTAFSTLSGTGATVALADGNILSLKLENKLIELLSFKVDANGIKSNIDSNQSGPLAVYVDLSQPREKQVGVLSYNSNAGWAKIGAPDKRNTLLNNLMSTLSDTLKHPLLTPSDSQKIVSELKTLLSSDQTLSNPASNTPTVSNTNPSTPAGNGSLSTAPIISLSNNQFYYNQKASSDKKGVTVGVTNPSSPNRVDLTFSSLENQPSGNPITRIELSLVILDAQSQDKDLRYVTFEGASFSALSSGSDKYKSVIKEALSRLKSTLNTVESASAKSKFIDLISFLEKWSAVPGSTSAAPASTFPQQSTPPLASGLTVNPPSALPLTNPSNASPAVNSPSTGASPVAPKPIVPNPTPTTPVSPLNELSITLTNDKSYKAALVSNQKDLSTGILFNTLTVSSPYISATEPGRQFKLRYGYDNGIFTGTLEVALANSSNGFIPSAAYSFPTDLYLPVSEDQKIRRQQFVSAVGSFGLMAQVLEGRKRQLSLAQIPLLDQIKSTHAEFKNIITSVLTAENGLYLFSSPEGVKLPDLIISNQKSMSAPTLLTSSDRMTATLVYKDPANGLKRMQSFNLSTGLIKVETYNTQGTLLSSESTSDPYSRLFDSLVGANDFKGAGFLADLQLLSDANRNKNFDKITSSISVSISNFIKKAYSQRTFPPVPGISVSTGGSETIGISKGSTPNGFEITYTKTERIYDKTTRKYLTKVTQETYSYMTPGFGSVSNNPSQDAIQVKTVTNIAGKVQMQVKTILASSGEFSSALSKINKLTDSFSAKLLSMNPAYSTTVENLKKIKSLLYKK